MRIALITVTLVAAALFLACPKKPNPASSSTHVALPAGWPAPALALPGDARSHPLSDIRSVPAGGGMTRIETYFPENGPDTLSGPNDDPMPEWSVGFSSAEPWDQLCNEIASTLLAAGYTEIKRDEGSTVKHKQVWLSEDRRILVGLKQIYAQVLPGQSWSEAYELSASVLPIPLDLERLKEYERSQNAGR